MRAWSDDHMQPFGCVMSPAPATLRRASARIRRLLPAPRAVTRMLALASSIAMARRVRSWRATKHRRRQPVHD